LPSRRPTPSQGPLCGHKVCCSLSVDRVLDVGVARRMAMSRGCAFGPVECGRVDWDESWLEPLMKLLLQYLFGGVMQIQTTGLLDLGFLCREDEIAGEIAWDC